MTQPRDISDDPIRQQRAKVAKIAQVAQRIGYLLFAVAVVLFFVGFFAGFTSGVVTAIVVAMVIGSFLLAPAIVAGYAVKAAERDDLEHGR